MGLGNGVRVAEEGEDGGANGSEEPEGWGHVVTAPPSGAGSRTPGKPLAQQVDPLLHEAHSVPAYILFPLCPKSCPHRPALCSVDLLLTPPLLSSRVSAARQPSQRMPGPQSGLSLQVLLPNDLGEERKGSLASLSLGSGFKSHNLQVIFTPCLPFVQHPAWTAGGTSVKDNGLFSSNSGIETSLTGLCPP